MRAPTAVAVLILAAGVAPSVALPLPGFTSEHAAPTPRGKTLVPPPQVKPLPNPVTRPASRPTVVILEPRPPGTPPAPRPPTRVPSASEEERPELPPLPLYPPRGPYPPVGTTPVNPQAQKSCFKKLWGKLCGNTLITPPSDEVFGQPNVRPSVPRPSSRPLLERFDELLIEQRAYEDSEELPTTSIADLD